MSTLTFNCFTLSFKSYIYILQFFMIYWWSTQLGSMLSKTQLSSTKKKKKIKFHMLYGHLSVVRSYFLIYFILTVKILVVIKSDGTFFFYFCQLVFSDNSTMVTFFFKTYTSLFFGC